MPTLKAKELRSLSIDELDEKRETLHKELFQLRWDVKLGKLSNVMKLSEKKRELAKVLTIKREMELRRNG